MGLVVKSNVKEHTGDMNVAGDFADELEKKVASLIKDACERAKANNRRTVMGKDL
jgi:histone H3/H4